MTATSRLRAVAVGTASALVFCVALVACGSPTAGPKEGVHDQGGADAFNVSLVAEEVIADITVDPARIGKVLVHAEFAPPGGKLQPVVSLTGNLVPSDASLSTIVLWFENSGTNHFHYETQVPTPGVWTLDLDAVLEDGTAALYTTPVTIAP
jgi:hypothetical protein